MQGSNGAGKMSLARTRQKQAGGFQKGVSGNPRGRPAGSRNIATLACEILLEGQAEALTQKAVELALAGDPVALRLCLDRIYPARKDHPVTFPLRPIYTARDAAEALSDVAVAVSAGEITPADGDAVSNVLGRAAKAFEIADGAGGAKPIAQCSDEELYRIVARASEREGAPNLLTHERQ